MFFILPWNAKTKLVPCSEILENLSNDQSKARIWHDQKNSFTYLHLMGFSYKHRMNKPRKRVGSCRFGPYLALGNLISCVPSPDHTLLGMPEGRFTQKRSPDVIETTKLVPLGRLVWLGQNGPIAQMGRPGRARGFSLMIQYVIPKCLIGATSSIQPCVSKSQAHAVHLSLLLQKTNQTLSIVACSRHSPQYSADPTILLVIYSGLHEGRGGGKIHSLCSLLLTQHWRKSLESAITLHSSYLQLILKWLFIIHWTLT